MKGFYLSDSGAIQGHHGPLVLYLVEVFVDVNNCFLSETSENSMYSSNVSDQYKRVFVFYLYFQNYTSYGYEIVWVVTTWGKMGVSCDNVPLLFRVVISRDGVVKS